ncbi:hypothetical protein Taro_040599 [Colocasia esculenta]|uniref:Uncharacterized protein n=1 Tax=Colocasia esculenta TaxID=4460 RepID=A0A843W9C9_COLES|nr:hypothetical protein [Colocasia esculenta]
MGSRWQGIWPSISQLMNLAIVDVDAKIFSLSSCRNPKSILQVLQPLKQRGNMRKLFPKPNMPHIRLKLHELTIKFHQTTLRTPHGYHDPKLPFSCRFMLSNCFITTYRNYKGHSLPQNTLKPSEISRFTPNPPRAPTGITPRTGVSSRKSATPHVPRSSNHSLVPVGSLKDAEA